MKFLALIAALFTASTASAAEPKIEVKFEEALGGGGVPITALHWGNMDGPAILLVPAYSQSFVNFTHQIDDAELAKEFHMASFDLRGHGQSGKPWNKDAYSDTQTWADDVAAVIKTLGLKKPVLVGWSFGGNVVMDYVRHYGIKEIAGIEFVGTLAGFGSKPAPETRAEDARPRTNRLSPDTRANVVGTPGLVDMLTAKPLPEGDRQLFMMSNAMVPAYVRRLLLGHPWNSEELLSVMKLPVLVATGTKDGSVKTELVQDLAKRLNAKLSIYQDIGPSPFYEETARFDRELAAFVRAANKK